MVRLFLFAIIGFVIFAGLRALLRKQNLSVKQFFGIYFATLIGLALLFLAASGKMSPIFGVLGAALPFLMRTFGLIMQGAQVAAMMKAFKRFSLGPGAGGAQNTPQSSEITTDFIHMVLFHDTGMMEGTVLAGQYKDAKLSQLEEAQLQALLIEIESDTDSYNLLHAYMEREYEGWQGSDQANSPPPSSSEMTEKEALDILDLEDDADKDAIISAHKRMMQKMHPDRGGSTYLATMINGAKDFLIKQRG
ncbi:MAG: hypothetical protein ACI8Z1_001490 [Candidatus Azotimanducaceae bacterium]|jgi:hypothetical protein